MLYELHAVDVVRIVTALRIEAGACARLSGAPELLPSTREYMAELADSYGSLASRILAGPDRDTTTTGGMDAG